MWTILHKFTSVFLMDVLFKSFSLKMKNDAPLGFEACILRFYEVRQYERRGTVLHTPPPPGRTLSLQHAFDEVRTDIPC